MTTPEQKERNKNYVLSHWDEYVLDSHGNFANSSPDIEGNEWFLCFGKDSFTPEGYEELKTKLFETILQEIGDWELVFDKLYNGEVDKQKVLCIRHKTSKRRIYKNTFDFKRDYIMIGKLGYRENIWKFYEEWTERWSKEASRKNPTQLSSENSPLVPPQETKNQDKNNFQNPTPPQNEQTNNSDNQTSPSPQAQTGTKEQKDQAFQNLENQEKINNLKKQQAIADPHQYSQEVTQRIEDKLKEYSLQEQDLTPNNQSALQQLKAGQITDPQQLVETENNLKKNIYQVETTKKVKDLTNRVSKVLQSKSKSQIDLLKKELLEFISSSSSSNIYYATKKQEVENLLEKLERLENNNQQNKPDNKITTKIVVGTVILLVLLLGMVMIILRKKKKRKIN